MYSAVQILSNDDEQYKKSWFNCSNIWGINMGVNAFDETLIFAQLEKCFYYHHSSGVIFATIAVIEK